MQRPVRPKLATMVRERIVADVFAGRWRPGDRLPTEVEMTEAFGVSRATIREAMQSLHFMGIVDISPRRGATLRALPVESVMDMAILSSSMAGSDRVDDVFEFRDATEGAIAELASNNHDPAQLERIRAILDENRDAVSRDDRAAAGQIDVRFHAAIAESSGNVVFTAVSAALGGMLAELRRTTGGIAGASAASLDEHEEIFAAIERRDAPSARRATERHVRNTRARFEAAGGVEARRAGSAGDGEGPEPEPLRPVAGGRRGGRTAPGRGRRSVGA